MSVVMYSKYQKKKMKVYFTLTAWNMRDTQHSLRQHIISLVSVDQVKKESAHLKKPDTETGA